jgi:hypothetical protein
MCFSLWNDLWKHSSSLNRVINNNINSSGKIAVKVLDFLRIMHKSLSGHWLYRPEVFGVSSVLPDYELTYIHWTESFLRSWQFVSKSIKSPPFFEPEGLLPNSQELARSIQSCSHPTYLKCISILFSHLSLGFPNGIFPSVFLTKILYAPLLFPCVLNAPPISFFLIWSTE